MATMVLPIASGRMMPQESRRYTPAPPRHPGRHNTLPTRTTARDLEDKAMGAPHSGKSFKLMSIDVHTIEDGKLTRSYHLEDWMGAVRQLSAQ